MSLRKWTGSDPMGGADWKTKGTPPGQIFSPGNNPFVNKDQSAINLYENGSYDYPVQTMGKPEAVLAQNFDLQRQRALGGVDAGVQSGTATGMSALMASGGLSAADRNALQAQGQRQRVSLSQGATAGIDQMASQNLYDTQKFNLGQSQQALDMNAEIMNQRARDLAIQNESRAVNIYQQRLKEAMLERQLDAARKIAQEQGV